MTVIRPIAPESVDSLGARARRCIYWQTDGGLAEITESIGDAEFEKEAWISRVSLEWGVCGQEVTHDARAAAAAFYSPPALVPRVESFPTFPVGSDAVLLAGLIEEPGSPGGILTTLLDEVVEDLRGRGIKALEAFGITDREASGDTGLIGSRDNCGSPSCVTATGFLVEYGFTVVADHETHPRLRLEIESDHQWKADVERALDQLFTERGVPMRPIGQLSGSTVSAHSPESHRAPNNRAPSNRAAGRPAEISRAASARNRSGR